MAMFQGPGRSAVYAENGAVATSHPLAAKAALDILQSGGNAADAAIAGAVLLGVCEPHMCGIGGDMFAIVKPASSEALVGLNGSGRAPAGLDAEALRAKGLAEMPEDTADAVVMPGAVAGFAALAHDHGRKGLDACLAPAIRYFEEGVPVAPRVAFDWARHVETLQGPARLRLLRNGEAPTVGMRHSAPDEAEVLRRVAAKGPEAFYEGEVADDMVAALRALGGVHRAEDFAAVAADYVKPISASYRGVEISELPPNGHGATALLIAGTWAHFSAPPDPFGAERSHLDAEITKLAYAARNRVIADPDHMTMPAEQFFGPESAAALAAQVDPARAQTPPHDPLAGAPHKDTILITVVDRDRMAVSLIYSIFNAFGSGLMSERFGILFANRGSGFTLERGHPNEAGGGKRPLHTIIPAMLREQGRITHAFGVMGGSYQAAGHMRFVSNIVDYGLGLQEAIDAPRSFAEDAVLRIEAGYGDAVIDELAGRGHRVERAQAGIGGAQAIRIDHDLGVLVAASDPRKDGIALGY